MSKSSVVAGILRRPKRLSIEEYMAKCIDKGIDEHGNFVVDSTPMAPPIGYKKQPSMVEMVREMIRSERLKAEAEAAGHESFEDSEDFDIEDDPELLRTPFENDFDPPLQELLRAGQEEVQKKARDKTSQRVQKTGKASDEAEEPAEPPQKEGVQGD